MTALENSILGRFKALLAKRLNLYNLILFGSRARGDADSFSDMDILVVLEGTLSERDAGRSGN